jgi:DNA ligase 1
MIQEVARFFESLYFAPDTERKQCCLQRFLETGDPDRGWVIATLTGSEKLPRIKRKRVLDCLLETVSEEDYRVSGDFVGDALETIALLWPGKTGNQDGLTGTLDALFAEIALSESDTLATEIFANVLDCANVLQRWFLLKVLVGSVKWGLSERAIIDVLAKKRGVEPLWLEARWHGVKAPYASLIQWLDGKCELPFIPEGACFHPMPVIQKCSMDTLKTESVGKFLLQTRPSGVLVQLVVTQAQICLYDKQGVNISHGFPDIIEAAEIEGVWVGVLEDLSGEADDDSVRRCLNRKKVTAQLTQAYPVRFILLDSLDPAWDVQITPEQKMKLDQWEQVNHPLLGIAKSVTLERWQDFPKADASRIILRRMGDVTKGAPRWIVLKQESKRMALVMLYAERSVGMKTFSTITLGLKDVTETWLPLAKVAAQFNVFDHDRFLEWIKNNQTGKYGPVIEVQKTLVIEVEYDSIKTAPRRKAGIFMDAAVIRKVRWEKSPDTLPRLEDLKNFDQ